MRQAWSFLAVILLASKWYEIHKEVELLTNVDKHLINMTSLMVNNASTSGQLDSPVTSDIMSTNSSTSAAAAADQTMINGGADGGSEDQTGDGRQMNLSQMIISKNANLKSDVDIFLGESA